MTVLISDSEDVLPDSPCTYQTMAIYKVLLCVTRTDHSYRPWTSQQYAHCTDVTSFFTMKGWMVWSTLRDIKLALCILSSVKSSYTVVKFRACMAVSVTKHVQETVKRQCVMYGTCFTCKPGWTGTTCNNRHCRDDSACNHMTGLCEGGCDDGWTGNMCNKECDGRTYGYDCINNCRGHCLNDSPCNKHTGHCNRGCNPGYTNTHCSTECPPGQFGFDCKERCRGQCINSEPCDIVSGVCSSGCQDGYIGAHCKTSCNEGFYGRNCSEVCSPNCMICRHTDGLCACKAGWSGPRCTEECLRSYGENCQYTCNTNCINKICDRFNGTCLFGCLNGRTCDLASQQNAEKEYDDISCTAWFIAFSIALVIIIILIIATIRLWRTSIKGNSNAGCVQSGRMPASGETQVGLSDGVSHYQELSVSKEHNTY